jgi:hypothetical protein
VIGGITVPSEGGGVVVPVDGVPVDGVPVPDVCPVSVPVPVPALTTIVMVGE